MFSEFQRFYLDWGFYPGEEVSHVDALAYGDYTRAQVNELGVPQFIELYDSGRLFHIDYWTSEPESIRGHHLSHHPGIPFGIESTVRRVGPYRWSVSRRYASAGNLVGYLVHLERSHTYDAALMTLRIDLQLTLKRSRRISTPMTANCSTSSSTPRTATSRASFTHPTAVHLD
ncbi:hypothetical protein ACWD2L_34455 [Streptomyces sp. NPDC002754]